MTITTKVVDIAKKKYGLDIIRHKEWGSNRQGVYAWRRRNKPAKPNADTVFQHITVTDPSGDFKANVRTVERIGYDRFKSGVSYNWVVDMDTGAVAAGMPLDAKGTHTVNNKNVSGYSYDQNYHARAIAVLGMPNTPLSKKAEESIAILLAAMMDAGAITDTFDYKPHSFVAWKDCPCDATRNRMGAIRRRAFELRKNPPNRVSKRQYTRKIRNLMGIRRRIIDWPGRHPGIVKRLKEAIVRLRNRRSKV